MREYVGVMDSLANHGNDQTLDELRDRQAVDVADSDQRPMVIGIELRADVLALETHASGRRAEHVWAEVGAGDAPAGGVLDRWPVLGADQGPLAEPVRDGLLFECWAVQESRNCCG